MKYLTCKEKSFYRDILDDLVVLSSAYNVDAFVDRAESNTLYGLGKPYLKQCCGIEGTDAEIILSVRMSAVQSVSVEEARTPFAIAAREKLSSSKDVQLLGEAGTFLVHATRQVAGKLDFDPVALGRSYLQRALQLNPDSTQARMTLASLARSEQTERLMNLLKGIPNESQYRAVASWPAAERFEYLPCLIQMSLGDADNADYHGEKVSATSAWERTRKYADDLLNLASPFRSSPSYGTAIYAGNIALSGVALHEGNQKRAGKYLLKASQAPPSDEMAYSAGGLVIYRLLAQLLKAGERESVIQFLERMAEVKVADRGRLLQAANAIRNGKAPFWYRSLVR